MNFSILNFQVIYFAPSITTAFLRHAEEITQIKCRALETKRVEAVLIKKRDQKLL